MKVPVGDEGSYRGKAKIKKRLQRKEISTLQTGSHSSCPEGEKASPRYPIKQSNILNVKVLNQQDTAAETLQPRPRTPTSWVYSPAPVH